jgi:hypothetical protein
MESTFLEEIEEEIWREREVKRLERMQGKR